MIRFWRALTPLGQAVVIMLLATVAHVAVRLAMHQRPRPAVEECR